MITETLYGVSDKAAVLLLYCGAIFVTIGVTVILYVFSRPTRKREAK